MTSPRKSSKRSPGASVLAGIVRAAKTIRADRPRTAWKNCISEASAAYRKKHGTVQYRGPFPPNGTSCAKYKRPVRSTRVSASPKHVAYCRKHKNAPRKSGAKSPKKSPRKSAKKSKSHKSPKSPTKSHKSHKSPTKSHKSHKSPKKSAKKSPTKSHKSSPKKSTKKPKAKKSTKARSHKKPAKKSAKRSHKKSAKRSTKSKKVAKA